MFRLYLRPKAWRRLTQNAPQMMGSLLILEKGWFPTLDTRFFPFVPFDLLVEVLAVIGVDEHVTYKIATPLAVEVSK